MKIITVFLFFLIFSGCASRFPTETEWSKAPVAQKEKTEFVLQGDFKDINEFLQTANQLKEGMSLEKVMELGFTTTDGIKEKNACDKLGWVETSEIVLKNTHLMVDFDSLEEIIAGKKQYEGIECEAVDIKSRQDRYLTYFNNFDTYKMGRRIKLVLIFKNRILFGVNINDQPIKEHNRESAFGKVIGDIFSPPEIKPSLPIK